MGETPLYRVCSQALRVGCFCESLKKQVSENIAIEERDRKQSRAVLDESVALQAALTQESEEWQLSVWVHGVFQVFGLSYGPCMAIHGCSCL